MPLASLFTQREIGSTAGSIRSRLVLRTPSGPQQVESALEKELLLQIDLSPNVIDVISQPNIDYEFEGKLIQYTPDFLLHVGPGLPFQPSYYLIEVKREDDLVKNAQKYERKFAGARDWCRQNVGEFRIVTDTEIRTPYLENAKLLRPHLNQNLDEEVLYTFHEVISTDTITVSELRQAMMSDGMPFLDANIAIKIAVANSYICCNLEVRFGDDSQLSTPTWDSVHDNRTSPVLRMIMSAKSGVEQYTNKVL